MIEKRAFDSLGGENHGWLNAKHHFSFANYHDPERHNWGALRVWNDDTIEAGTGFPPHPHNDMEIITYVRKGAITHKDSLGNVGRTEAGDVQVMSAGTGIRHSEYNQESEETQIFQIWIFPNQKGDAPAWGSQPFPKGERSGQFVILASGIDGDANALPIRTNARVVGATVQAGQTLEYAFDDASRLGYLVPATGRIKVNGVEVNARDGIAIKDETVLRIEALEDSELVLVDTADLH